MTQKNIELELRAEVPKGQYSKLLSKLKKGFKMESHTERLSVMCFGSVGKNTFDVRIRITNGKAEVVIKKGKLHAHDRIEISSPINKSQFIRMVELFSLFDFKMEVAERETYNFNMGDDIIFSLVNAGKIAYIEIEKMSSKRDVEKNKKKLMSILTELNLRSITKQAEFDKICNELSRYSDWPFNGSGVDYKKLEKALSRY